MRYRDSGDKYGFRFDMRELASIPIRPVQRQK